MRILAKTHSRRAWVGFLAVFALAPALFGQEAHRDAGNWSSDELLKLGRALSNGATLVQTLQSTQPPSAPLSAKSASVVDTTKINVPALREQAVHEAGEHLGEQAITASVSEFAPRAGARAGAAYTLYSFNQRMYDAWRVGTGRADPTVLRSSVPHAVMAWEAIRGPENLPTQVFSRQVTSQYADGAWSSTLYRTQITRQTFSSTAPGLIKSYGYDPYTDRLVRQTVTRSVQVDSFDGMRFNQVYRSQLPTVPQPGMYRPPTAPLNVSVPAYTPPPQTYTQPPLSTAATPAYTPRPIYTPSTGRR